MNPKRNYLTRVSEDGRVFCGQTYLGKASIRHPSRSTTELIVMIGEHKYVANAVGTSIRRRWKFNLIKREPSAKNEVSDAGVRAAGEDDQRSEPPL